MPVRPWEADDLFLVAFGKTLMTERGYVNVPTDRGGETKFGVSKRSWGHRFPRIADLTLDDAARLFFEEYWKPAGCDRIRHFDVAWELYDSAILHGAVPAIRFLQQALNTLGQRVTVDGRIGPQTLGAANNYPHPESLAAAQNVEQGAYVKAIVADDPSQLVNYRGWLKRLQPPPLE